MSSAPSPTDWNASLYQGNHSFVWKYGASLIELLAPQAGERILDLGCGTGQLTAQIAATGARVVGFDSSAEMLNQARQNHPGLRFELADAREFALDDGPFDAVFSNAVLHWIKPPEQVVRQVCAALRPGGRFVAEFGGRGNTRRMLTALRRQVAARGLTDFETPWYFPGIAEYAAVLESQGLEVTSAVLFDRPTPLDGEEGVRKWFEMFLSSLLERLTPDERSRFFEAIEEELRPHLYRDGTWFADYRRLRFVAQRPE